jgi:hypothetical protein
VSGPSDTGARPPAIWMPYPLDEYLDALPGDYGKVTRRLLRAARWARGDVGGVELDAGEALMDERSEKLWGGLTLERDVSAAGRRALIRRVLDRLERDGIVARRSAHARGPRNGPGSGPRNGPSPTVVRFLKFRGILWPASAGTAQETAQGPAQETALQSGPVLPEDPPAPPDQQQPRARAAVAVDDAPPPPRLEVVDESEPAQAPFRWAKAASFRQALTDSMARTVLYPVGGREPETWSSLEASLTAIPEAEAVEICRERILAAHAAGKRAGGTLAYFAQVLADEGIRRQRAAPKRAQPEPVPAGPAAYTALLGRAAATVPKREGLCDDLRACTPALDGGELVLTTSDRHVADRLTDLHDVHGFARQAIPGVGLRIVAPPARAAGGAP